ncbi:MAG: hypothetical protein LBV59_10500 [Sphingobacterium sp.]|jgi:hypothetical protein|uniref:hypothetical protein n=1 Tax=unclassified Sphingobacterium TaxID=2609468 RepID=UPI00284029CC|nr:hypothetical protein [Sphingobacterium sp.]MDR3008355.1 hypothetical protein [Sphingobacterium sp.]
MYKLVVMKVRQVLIFKSSVKTKDKKNFLMQLVKTHLPQIQDATVDLDDEDAIFRVETEECSVDYLTNFLHGHGIQVDFLDRFVVA